MTEDTDLVKLGHGKDRVNTSLKTEGKIINLVEETKGRLYELRLLVGISTEDLWTVLYLPFDKENS